MTMTSPYPGLPDPETRPEFYAGVPLKRGLAWIVDTLVVGLLTGVAIPFTAFIGLIFLPALFFVVSFLYRWVLLANGSATLGMRLFAIEFRDRDGRHFDPGLAFLHTAGYIASFAIFPLQLVSIALMLISERGQGLTDHVIGTAAIHRVT